MDLADLRTETDRMTLRSYRLADYPDFADMHGRDDVARYLPWETRTAEESKAALERYRDMRLDVDGDGITLAAFLRSGNGNAPKRLVGEFVLFLRSVEHRGGELGYVIHPDFWGRGLATEGALALASFGFDFLRLHRIIARIDARNAASAAVLRRIGMRKEAHLVKNELFKGEWSDEADYALLDEEWANRSNKSAISWNTTAPAPLKVSAGDRPPANP